MSAPVPAHSLRAPAPAPAGIFVVLEGPEGAGKSTQAARLAEHLRGLGFDVVLTREPGGTAIGERIRALLLDPSACAMLAETEALLYAAARAQHVREVVGPALARGAVVVCDRYADSTLAYQGGGRGLPLDLLRDVQRLATGALEPDLRVLLDLPVEAGLARRFGAPESVNRLDAAGVAFHRRVRDAYLALVTRLPEAWVVVDAARPPAEVGTEVAEAVVRRLAALAPSREVGPGPGSGPA